MPGAWSKGGANKIDEIGKEAKKMILCEGGIAIRISKKNKKAIEDAIRTSMIKFLEINYEINFEENLERLPIEQIEVFDKFADLELDIFSKLDKIFNQ